MADRTASDEREGPWAHSPNQRGEWHPLVEHLRGTAERAATLAAPFGGSESARLLGLFHDLGKFNPAWQRYLADSTVNPTLRGTGPEHKLAGALLASRHALLQPFSLAIAGHHGGLPALTDFKNRRLTDEQDLQVAEESLRLARLAQLDLDPDVAEVIPAAVLAGGARAAEHFVRMVFSALVDADFLDTEWHFDTARAMGRSQTTVEMQTLLQDLIADQETRFAGASGRVAEARREIFEASRRAAELPPGVFRLTVPTGGGKTRAGLAFALEHAVRHGHRRVIVAVPFLSITEQTAEVYRDLFPGEGTVLEHHSAFQENGHEGDLTRHVTWSRLAAENWDAPLVVTTTVQLLESLFGHRPSRTRKLHNIAGSVVVLDEVQSLPVPLLTPTLEMLHDLTKYYGVTVVLSTATQPRFEVLPAFAAVAAHEIVPDPGRFYEALERVTYESRTARRQTWDEIADWLGGEHQALAIVNTKADALALLDALEAKGVAGALHLSTLLCGAHRRDTIEAISRRLKTNERCLVVSTQVVEAGVDLDFPAVYRAIGPLDAIIQAAGRCNREGHLDRGRVVIFDPAEGGMPGGAYRTATDQARPFLGNGYVDLDSPQTVEAFYHRFLALPDTDARDIQSLRARFDYPAVAQRYRLIDDDTEAIVITDYGTSADRARVAALIEEARHARGNARAILRALQPYIVAVRRRQVPGFVERGLIEPLVPGLSVWHGEYDDVRGLAANGPADALVI